MRLSDIVTRTGDKGETGLADGRRVLKNHPYIEAIGAVDSLNSILGWAIVPGTDNLVDELEKIQQDLFNLGAELALPSLKGQKLKQDRLDWLDMRI
jgi:cob(I)alamin adenosyltransferase